MDKQQQICIWYVLFAAIALLSMQSYLGGHAENSAYSDFKSLLTADAQSRNHSSLETSQ